MCSQLAGGWISKHSFWYCYAGVFTSRNICCWAQVLHTYHHMRPMHSQRTSSWMIDRGYPCSASRSGLCVLLGSWTLSMISTSMCQTAAAGVRLLLKMGWRQGKGIGQADSTADAATAAE